MNQAKDPYPPYYPSPSNPPAGIYDQNANQMTDQFQQERIGQANPPLYTQNYPSPNYAENPPPNYGQNPFVPPAPQYNPQGGYAVGQPIFLPAMSNPGGPGGPPLVIGTIKKKKKWILIKSIK